MSDTLRESLGVSRETFELFEEYVALLRQWNPAINLISRATEDDIWLRHVIDSAQIWKYRPETLGKWLDLGSGAGFPGLVVALIAKDSSLPVQFGLVESDARKCAFLRTVIYRLELDVTVHEARVNNLAAQNADVISARALAALPDLLGFSEKHRNSNGICLFPKGRTVHNEIEVTRVHWHFDADIHQSLTDPSGCIVEIGAFSRV